jgi:cytochrome c oxidase assembly protein subunit 15
VAAAVSIGLPVVDSEADRGDGLVAAWLFLVAFLVVCMVAVGGATRLTDSGLSITEWKPLLGAIPPLSDADWQAAFNKYRQIPEYQKINKGMSLAEFQFIYWWEWGHRFLGRAIGLVYALPLALFWTAGRIPSGRRLAMAGVLLLGGLQGFVGWYMVQSGLVERVDVSQYRLALHLTLAFLILAALLVLAASFLPRDPLARLQPVSTAARVLAWFVWAVILAQVVLGAFVAGTKAGLAYNTWPLMDGELIPSGRWALEPWYLNLSENITAIQFNHRMMAYAVLALALVHTFVLFLSSDRVPARWSAGLLVVGLFAQAGLGIWTLLAVDGAIPITLGVVHQTAAAIIFALATLHLTTLKTRQMP